MPELTSSQPADTSLSVRDVVVIGSGPAGSSVAALLAESGHDVVLLDREHFPRHHVGESLIPAANRILGRLGLIDQLQDSSFVKKYSVQFVGADGQESTPFYFDDFDPLGLGHTWQVVRSSFDRLLVERANELGAEVRTNTQATAVDFHEDTTATVWTRRIRERDGSLRPVRCRVVVDASGQSSFLANRMKLRQIDPRLRNGTIWTWYHNAKRGTGRDEGATIIFSSRGHKSWFWYIPLPNNIVSVGCTADTDWMFNNSLSTAEIFTRELSRCPSVAERLTDASQAEPFRTTRDFSYSSSELAGTGWVLVGDAYSFIDPVYSSGVFLALASGEMAATAIHEALETNNTSADQLGNWKQCYDSGVEKFRQLVYAFYDPCFNFADFIRNHPDQRENLTELLVGNVFKPGVSGLFDGINPMLTSA